MNDHHFRPYPQFIVLEGPDGSGKSTQFELLKSFLSTHHELKHLPILWVKDPGGTLVSEQIRSILLDPAHENMSPTTEYLLYLASRAQLLHEKIIPQIKNGGLVISDRFTLSTFAYQIYESQWGQKLDELMSNKMASEKINWLLSACQGIVPDITLVFQCPQELSLQRINTRGLGLDRMEQKKDLFAKIYGAYQLVVQQPQHFKWAGKQLITIDSSHSPNSVHQNVLAVLKPSLALWKQNVSS